MLIVTDMAGVAIKALLTATPGTLAAGGLRINSDPSTLAGTGFALSLAPEPTEDDHVLETAGVRVFLTSRAYPGLQNRILDASQGPAGTVNFTLANQPTPQPVS